LRIGAATMQAASSNGNQCLGHLQSLSHILAWEIDGLPKG
jgi:hypothetical protein